MSNDPGTTAPAYPTTLSERQAWWNGLNDQWKKAFNEVMLEKGPVTDMPDEEGLAWILESPSFRFAGPTAFHANMSFELTDLTGLAAMHHTTFISVTFHQIKNIDPIAHLTQLTSLFLSDNGLESIEGVQNMKDLKNLYINGNKVPSLLPLTNLKNLEQLHAGSNKLSSFEGLSEENTEHFVKFVGLPNRVAKKEIERIENDLRLKVHKS